MGKETKPCLIPAGSKGFGGAYTNYERDSIEETLLPWLSLQTPGTIVDIGCGHGGLGVRMARQGHKVLCWDVQPECVEASHVHFTQEGLESSFLGVSESMEHESAWRELAPKHGFIAITLMRSLIWVPADKALRTLICSRDHLAPGGRIWFIVLGSEAPIIPDHHKLVPVRDRFLPISGPDADFINMHQPITVYSKDELIDLFSEAGLSIGELRTTSYGHHKGYAVSARA